MLSPVEEIKERIDVVDFLKDYLELRPAGKNYKALCPFHGEKTPSLIVSPERQIWHCFGCQAGGDIFKFLMLYENIEFAEALKILADKAGIELKRLSPADEKQFGVLYNINEAAAEFFRNELNLSNRAREYLEGRKISDETIGFFGLGFAPAEFEALTLHLLHQGFEVTDILRSGLIFKTDRGKYIDRFRGRIMFPIENHFGKIVGFSGRLLPELEAEGVGKYINSPETPVFNKSRLLYGFSKSKSAIREKKAVLLLEGQMDFLSVWQAGIDWAVATSGTAFTTEHLKTLKRLTDRAVVGFDSDEAGRLAAERAIDLLNESDFSSTVVDWGGDKDAAEAATKGNLIDDLKKAEPAMEYLMRHKLSSGSSEPEAKTNLRFLLQRIQKIWSPIERSRWIKRLAERTGLKEADLAEEMVKIGSRNETVSSRNQIEKESSRLSRPELIAFYLLSLIEADESLGGEIAPYEKYLPDDYKLAAESILKKNETAPSANANNLLNLISLRSSLYADYEPERRKDELSFLLRELEIAYLSGEKEKVGREIKRFEKEEAAEDLIASLRTFDEISKKIQDIKNEKPVK